MKNTGYSQAANDLKTIMRALTMVMEGGSMIANAVLSSVGGIVDGYLISHGDVFRPQLLIQSGALGTEATTPGLASNPKYGIRWRMDTGGGFTSTRLLRSIRGSWIAGGALIQTVSAPSNAGSAIPVGTAPAVYISPLSVGSPPYSAADALSNYFSLVRDLTCLFVPNPAGPPAYLQYPFLAANGTPGLPDWQVLGIGEKKIGFGWPPVKGRDAAFR